MRQNDFALIELDQHDSVGAFQELFQNNSNENLVIIGLDQCALKDGIIHRMDQLRSEENIQFNVITRDKDLISFLTQNKIPHFPTFREFQTTSTRRRRRKKTSFPNLYKQLSILIFAIPVLFIIVSLIVINL